ncbi:MAG: iron-containing alcohol dehydrogenase [Oscillospiraceae bacterium]
MDNFVFNNPTKIIFGENNYNQISNELKSNNVKKVLLHMGGGSIKKNGVYDNVVDSLKKCQIDFVELWGVEPNPRLSLVYDGIKICQNENIDFILAVGGGSVIDSAKAISLGVNCDGDVWDFFIGKKSEKDIIKKLPIGVVLTIPAAGSEASCSTVISNEKDSLKRSFVSNTLFPVFSFLDPSACYTLPSSQTAYGSCDIMSHLMERYFTNSKNVDFTDRLIEASLKTIIHHTPLAIKNPDNYNHRSQIMWCGTIAHNTLLGTGREEDWASHSIEHEISAIYDIAHGAGLAIVFPAWMKFVYKNDIDRFVQFASRVFGVETSSHNKEEIALEGIKRLEDFYTRIGLPTRMSHINLTGKDIDIMSKKALKGNETIGFFVKLKENDVKEIYKLSL